jgi:hypothetical protein
MKKTIVILTLLTSFSSYADLELNIKARGMGLSAIGVYASTSTSFFCTHLNGDFQRVPKVMDKQILVNNTGSLNQINVVENLHDNCQSSLKGVSLKVHHPKINPEQARIEINASNLSQEQNNQKIIFKKFTSPYGDFYGVEDSAQILVGPEGIVNAEILLQE